MLVMADAGAYSKDYALHQAVLDDDIQLVRKLISKGAAIDVIGSRKYGYGSALHLAVREDHLEIAKLLLERGAQVDVLDPDDFTPLHNAAWNGNLEMTELLLAAGANIEASTYDGDTPLKLAQNNGQAQVAEFLQVKLQPAVTGDTKIESTAASDSGVRDVSGTYVMTNLTGNWLVTVFVSKPKITIAQNGDQLTGTYDEGRGKLWGEIKGDTIELDWAVYMHTGTGKWTFKPGSNEPSVSLNAQSGLGEVKFNLTKIETEADSIDISGTYIAETTAWGSGMNHSLIRKIKIVNGKLIVLKQTGNTITGSVGSISNWIIKGTREGNTINFYISVGNQIIGSWEINADATNLEGKWFTNGAGGASGIWNLTKIEADD
jgi:hypothetical protein